MRTADLTTGKMELWSEPGLWLGYWTHEHLYFNHYTARRSAVRILPVTIHHSASNRSNAKVKGTKPRRRPNRERASKAISYLTTRVLLQSPGSIYSRYNCDGKERAKNAQLKITQ